MSFIDQRLPVKISLGSSISLGFKTDVVEYSGGGEYRNSRWVYHKQGADLAYVVRNRAEALAVYNFFLAAKGRFHSFRVYDYLDNTSASDSVSTPTALDQLIGTGDGSTVTFQLSKTYTTGVASYTKKITKPVTGSVLISVDGTPTTAFSVDTSTGIVTMDVAPGIGLSVKAGFSFDYEMRFDTDDLSDIAAILLRDQDRSKDFIDFPPVPVIEVIDG